MTVPAKYSLSWPYVSSLLNLSPGETRRNYWWDGEGRKERSQCSWKKREALTSPLPATRMLYVTQHCPGRCSYLGFWTLRKWSKDAFTIENAFTTAVTSSIILIRMPLWSLLPSFLPDSQPSQFYEPYPISHQWIPFPLKWAGTVSYCLLLKPPLSYPTVLFLSLFDSYLSDTTVVYGGRATWDCNSQGPGMKYRHAHTGITWTGLDKRTICKGGGRL